MRHTTDFNPLTRAMTAGRSALSDPDGDSVLQYGGALLALASRLAVDVHVPGVSAVGVTRQRRGVRGPRAQVGGGFMPGPDRA